MMKNRSNKPGVRESNPPPSRRWILTLAILAAVPLIGLGLIAIPNWTSIQAQQGAENRDKGKTPLPDKNGEPAGATKLPVILLTGFEPFGPDKPANPSWEGIKPLDGKEWRGHRIVAKQARVIWGAPMEQLNEWIDQHQPVAIFSFGQGMPGVFAFESKASNSRGPIGDNDGAKPKKIKIVEGGPEQVNSTFPCEMMAKAMAKKGYPARVSTRAGRYLCEEMLYTIEYQRSSKKVPGPVMFCHVPPLNTELAGKPVTPAHITEFVTDLLETWFANKDQQLTAEPTDPASDPRFHAVKEMIERYFRTWSNQDMKGYEDCFFTEAVIQHLDGNGRISSTAKAQFIASQRDYHRTSPDRTIEVPESIDIKFEQNLARVVVKWKLTAGTRVEHGYDHFTLNYRDKNWRIVNLVYYGVK